MVLAALALAVSVQAADPKGLAEAKAVFERSTHDEAARQVYVGKLSAILGEMVADKMLDRRHHDPAEFDALFAELKRHPFPKTADAKKLSQLRAGKWQSPRHDYLYRANGTWTMLPADPEATNGRWRIEGNQIIESVHGDTKETRETLIWLGPKEMVFTDGTSVFYERRL